MQTAPTERGLVYMWQGYSGDIKLQSFPALLTRQVTRVALGGEHSLFLTSDLEVFSCGANSYGQLGLGSVNSEENPDPQLITCLSGIIHSFISSFIHSLTHSLTHSFTHSLIHSLTFIHSLIHSFIHSFIVIIIIYLWIYFLINMYLFIN